MVVLAAVVGASSAAPAHAYEARVPADYFGVSAPELVELARNSETARLDRHAAAMQAAGLSWARTTFDWRLSELISPVGGVHVYDWSWTDRLVGALARKNLTTVPNILGAPVWARDPVSVLRGCSGKSALAASSASAFGAYAEAVVRRYGRNGAFWAQNPSVPYQPIDRVEVWNEPNWHAYWCPTPSPEAFAPVLHAAATGISKADPGADVVLGGLVTIKEDARFSDGTMRGMAADTYLQRLVAAEPTLPGLIDSVGIHLYESDPAESLSLLGWLRRTLNTVGMGSADMLVTEFGWSTVGLGSVSESERAEAYRKFLNVLPRTDCGLSGIAAHTWFSFESDLRNPEDWFGIVDPSTAEPYGTGAAYADMIDLWRGRGPTPAPRDVLTVCNAPEVDQDGDGTADELDDYPFDPSRQTGANEPPPPTEEPPAEAKTMAPAVPDRFFGATDVWLPEEGPLRQAHYDSMKYAGFGVIRQQLQWKNIQRSLTATPDYEWAETDRRVLALTRRGIGMSPALINPPDGTTSGDGAVDDAYAALMGSLAERYGRGGSYWEENGHLDESLAVRDYEVWQAGNASWGAWDRTPAPAEYARTYRRTKEAIRAADPEARVIASLVDHAEGGYAGKFLEGMVAADPSLRGGIDGVYVMAKDARTAVEAEAVAAEARLALEATGNSSAKLYIGFGAPTQGDGAVTETERVAMISEIASALPRSDCGVDGAFVFAWATRSEDPANTFDWFGIASLAEASLLPTGTALRETIRSFLGLGSTPAPQTALHGCLRQALDRDGDGAPDAVDSHPLDPTQKGTPPPPPPAPSFSVAPPELGNSRSASLAFSAERAIAYQCRFDGSAWRECASPYSASGLADGQHTLVVRGLDSAGVVGAESTRTWRIDTKAPSISIDSGPSGLVLSDSVTFTTSSDEPGSFRCQLDSSTWRDCAAIERLTGITDGHHVFRVLAIDRAGNQSGTYAAGSFETRTLPRTPSILAVTGSPGQTPKVTFDAGFAVRYECRYDNDVYAPCSGTGSHVPEKPLSHGSHRFYVRGIGGTGIAGPAASAPITVVDADDPETTIGPNPSGVVLTDSPQFHLSSDEHDAKLFCRMDAVGWGACPADGRFSGLADGGHTLSVVAVDTAGNADETPAARSFEIRTQPGGAEITSGPIEGAESAPSPRFEFQVPYAVAAECRFDGAEFAPCSDLRSHEPSQSLAAGTHVFEVRGLGGTGKVGAPAIRSFVVTSTPPAQCRGEDATLVGTPGNDTLKGTAGADVIVLGDGADVVASGSGDDLICSGNGKDRLAGEDGADVLIGGAGRDRCSGGSGKDRLKGC